MSGLVDRHLDFLVALRAAGVPVSLAEGVDAVAALSTLRWEDRETVRTAYAATVVKRATHRSTFDTLFDLYYPPLVGAGASTSESDETGVRDDAAARDSLREELLAALATGDAEAQRRLAVEAVGRFGAMPGREPVRLVLGPSVVHEGRDDPRDEVVGREPAQGGVGRPAGQPGTAARHRPEPSHRLDGQPALGLRVAGGQRGEQLLAQGLARCGVVADACLVALGGRRARSHERREVQVEQRVEGRPVRGPLDDRRGVRRPHRLAVVPPQRRERRHRVDALGERHRDARLAQGDEEVQVPVDQTLGVVLKHASDQAKAVRELKLRS